MLKARNIFIIFIINYLLILLACCILEIAFISRSAQEAQLLMRTAADMALEQVQATDDFFVTGGGYLLGDSNPGYKMFINSGSTFEQVELFPAFTGEGSTKSDVGRIYSKLYLDGGITRFIEDAKGDVLSLTFVAGYTQPPYSYTMTQWVDTDGNGTADSRMDLDFSSNILKTNWYAVPKIYQMGEPYLMIDNPYGQVEELGLPSWVSPNFGTNRETVTYSKTTDLNSIWSMYELDITQKTASLPSGEDVNYYFTPISLGITYLNEDLLQALYMNNLDLLMRSKYMTRFDYDLNSEECGNGVLKTAFYPELVDTSSLDYENPINNGSFTLLRGRRMSGTSFDAYFYEGTVKPKIEYFVIDMYDDNANDILQQIFGPRFTNDTADSSYFSDPGQGSEFRGQTITGTTFKKIDKDSINMLKDVTGVSRSNTSTILDCKPIVVAKVTFYADFIIPYSTVSLREMRGREVNNEIFGRQLFDAFSNASNTGTSYVDGNYVDLELRTLLSMDGRDMDEDLYPSSYYTERSADIAGSYNSDAMMYTTYFAITP